MQAHATDHFNYTERMHIIRKSDFKARMFVNGYSELSLRMQRKKREY